MISIGGQNTNITPIKIQENVNELQELGWFPEVMLQEDQVLRHLRQLVHLGELLLFAM